MSRDEVGSCDVRRQGRRIVRARAACTYSKLASHPVEPRRDPCLPRTSRSSGRNPARALGPCSYDMTEGDGPLMPRMHLHSPEPSSHCFCRRPKHRHETSKSPVMCMYVYLHSTTESTELEADKERTGNCSLPAWLCVCECRDDKSTHRFMHDSEWQSST